MKIICPNSECGKSIVIFLNAIKTKEQLFLCKGCNQSFNVFKTLSQEKQSELKEVWNKTNYFGIITVKTIENVTSTYKIDKEYVTIGRKDSKGSIKADIEIDTSDLTMSRKHFELFYSKKDGGRFTLKSLKPLNGTFIEVSKNNEFCYMKEIKGLSEVYLDNNLMIRCGQTKLIVDVRTKYEELNKIEQNDRESGMNKTVIIS